ncbi:MAG: hypothetical protein QY331_01875 [Melioribacteraceae bacterium]|nr:MAG: hypothetical protein QY331_01875 [Melioribacteraceae bacterium]
MKNYFKSFHVFFLHFILCPLSFILLPLSFILVSCNTTEPPPDNGNGNGNDEPKPKITLTVDDTSPTEVWLNLTTENISLPDTLKLFRNNDKVKTIELFDSSFIFYQDSLLPSQSYTYTAIINDTVTSEATAITMDTTSHNFSYEIFEFGEHGNSVLRDVAIIDENNIWAVGAIYLKDSTGANDSKLYNAVHWNGNEWQPLRIVEEGFLLAPEYSIYAIAEDDIWIGGSIPQHWDGNIWTFWGSNKGYEGGFYIKKIWAKSSDEVYLVGGNGNIRHYNGTSWRKIESGTDVDLRDVTGNQNGTEIYISGYSTDYSKSVLMKLSNNVLNVIWENKTLQDTPPYGSTVNSIKLLNNDLFIASNIGVFRKKLKYTLPDKKLYYPPRWVYKVTGTNVNDTYSVGDRLSITHFNGSSERQVFIDYSQVSPLYSADSKENIIVAVGTKVENVLYHKAIIIKLKR